MVLLLGSKEVNRPKGFRPALAQEKNGFWSGNISSTGHHRHDDGPLSTDSLQHCRGADFCSATSRAGEDCGFLAYGQHCQRIVIRGSVRVCVFRVASRGKRLWTVSTEGRHLGSHNGPREASSEHARTGYKDTPQVRCLKPTTVRPRKISR